MILIMLLESFVMSELLCRKVLNGRITGSRHEIDLSAPNALCGLSLFYLVAFVLSVLIEEAVNWLFLSETYTSKKILWVTLVANIASYLLGSIVLYSISFS